MKRYFVTQASDTITDSDKPVDERVLKVFEYAVSLERRIQTLEYLEGRIQKLEKKLEEQYGAD